MPAFNGQLKTNEIYAALYNMIISQQVFADNIYDTKASLVDAARVDGGLYGDTKLYYSTDVLQTHAWGNDAEAANLLSLDRANSPETQAITLDVFRQIRLTLDNYLSKRAWGTEGAFGQFTSVMLGWIRDTKRVYDSTTYNTFIGTNETSIGDQQITITVGAEPAATADNPDIEAYNRLTAQTIAQRMSNLMVQLEDVTRDYNDYGHLRSYSGDSLIAVWNSEVVNKINKIDLPMIFHKDSAKADKFAEYTLPARYFGTINTTAGSAPASNLSIRSLIETDYTVGTGTDAVTTHVFPGDLVPGGAAYAANNTYTVDGTIAFKLMHKRSVPFMSAFEVGTSFFNPRSLTENHYLTWGRNTLEHLKNYPFITVRVVPAAAPAQASVQNDAAPAK